jgi:MoxR-like ATPase/aerobic-type carbon monoxide dehydrogenase small subunit (CoxS/CutS family)
LLLDFIRDHAGLTGSKRGCNEGKCGACTVMLGGLTVKACNLLAMQAQGKEILTIEGFSCDDTLSPLQQCCHENHSLQCGFRTAGFLMSAKYLLEHTAEPSDAEIREAIHRNVCRCTGYQKIVDGIRAAAVRFQEQPEAVGAKAGTQLPPMIQSIRDIEVRMGEHGYVSDPTIATAVFLLLELKKPILVEGHAGVGKTEIAKILAKMLDTTLIRLQCYEGLDVSTALYEWNYQKQILRMRLEDGSGHSPEEKEQIIFGPQFLLKRPLLSAITHPDRSAVLLIDEIDRADEEFEAFLLEVLSDFQVSIPEMGTIRATHVPYVILTSNRTRELSDALRRRCQYLWIDYPSFEKEISILQMKVPGIDGRLAKQITTFMQRIRTKNFLKKPGVAEMLDWASSLLLLHRNHLDREAVEATLGCIIKDIHDLQRVSQEQLDEVLAEVEAVHDGP